MAKRIKAPVGKRGKNNSDDVLVVQELLKKAGYKLGKTGPKKDGVDGDYGAKTEAAITALQKKLGFKKIDSLIEPGKTTWNALVNGGKAPPEDKKPADKKEEKAKQGAGKKEDGNEEAAPNKSSGYFSHAGASKVKLTYDGKSAKKMKPKAEDLLKSILASCSMPSARITSTLRTYHDQARITATQTYKRKPATVKKWYGQAVFDACVKYEKDIAAFAKWWEAYDKKRGKLSSRHLGNRALDVVPKGNRAIFAKKVKSLIPVSGSGVKRIIEKGQMGEPVDHVEFTFDVC